MNVQLRNNIPVYIEAPFIRILIALVTGIILQWYLRFNSWILLYSFAVLLFFIFILPSGKTSLLRQKIQSIAFQLVFIVCGLWLVFIHDVRNRKNYFIPLDDKPGTRLIVRLQENVTEKTNSFKALGEVKRVVFNDSGRNGTASVLLYFKKDSLSQGLKAGTTLLINKTVDPIRNSGNPGSFDYAQYCIFNGIGYRVFLNHSDYRILQESDLPVFQVFLSALKSKILAVLDRWIEPDKEKAVAEALLIGYRDDLDKDLVQAYSNTGTIHIIAISGLHLGFIYCILVVIFKPFQKNKWVFNWLKPIVILFILWTFTFLAGGAASILRSAIMFSCLLLGESMGRKSSVYNSLAFSAFIILCLNPFQLWDAGFQLSYAAVLSILIFMQPVYQLFTFKNKIADRLWQLNAVTVSAQILTAPFVIYHFHQFPNLFLVTNFVAVPLSTLILGGELLLMVCCWIAPVARFIATALTQSIRFLNSFIERCGNFPFATTDYLHMNVVQCCFLFALIISVSYWILNRYKPALFAALLFLVISLGARLAYRFTVKQQQKLIVYNIPRLTAIDLVDGNKFSFIGDRMLRKNELYLKYLKPARTALGTDENEQAPVAAHPPIYRIAGNNILLLDAGSSFKKTETLKKIAVVVLSKNPVLYMDTLIKYFEIGQVVADGSNPEWKIKLWQKDCIRLQIPFYNAAEAAFIKSF